LANVSASNDGMTGKEWVQMDPLPRLVYRATIKQGKSVPLQVWSSPEGSRKLRFPDYVTIAQDGGKIVSLTHRPPLPPRNTPGSNFC